MNEFHIKNEKGLLALLEYTHEKNNLLDVLKAIEKIEGLRSSDITTERI